MDTVEVDRAYPAGSSSIAAEPIQGASESVTTYRLLE
jgi:hypothetical protein